LVALAHLADREQGLPTSARELAELAHAPRTLLTGVLGQLQQAGMIISRRGVNGGYTLERPASEITVLEVIRAVEGQTAQLTPCCGEPVEEACSETDPCRITESCQTRWQIQRLNERVNDLLDQTTIADLLPPQPAGALQGADRPGFVIH
jgi:Rrf2 family protein